MGQGRCTAFRRGLAEEARCGQTEGPKVKAASCPSACSLVPCLTCTACGEVSGQGESAHHGASDGPLAHGAHAGGSDGVEGTAIGGGSEDTPADGCEEEHEQEGFQQRGVTPEALASAEDPLLDMTHPTYREVASADGSAYRGQVQPGGETFHGYGCLRSAETTAVGYWCNGKLHGQGQQSWPDGRVYRGQFRGGAFAGRGRMQWRHGRGAMVYEGEYLDDKKHGEGRFTWPSGKAYDGQWVRGQRHGVGEDISADGVRCRGLWQDNVFLHSIGAGCDAGESAK